METIILICSFLLILSLWRTNLLINLSWEYKLIDKIMASCGIFILIIEIGLITIYFIQNP